MNDIMSRIWRERNECALINFGNPPDNVMLHPLKRWELLEQSNLVSGNVYIEGMKEICFGMSIIYTNMLEENEIVCTYDGKKRIKPAQTNNNTPPVADK